jgi:hypothetical protein
VHTIEIDDDVMDILRGKAEPFADTPNSVLRRLFGIEREVARSTATSVTQHPSGGARRRARKSTRKREKSQRAPTGSILPEQEYVRPLLEVLDEKGGRAPAREIIDEVGRRLKDRLTPLDREPVASGGLRWQNRVQFARLRLIDRGLLKKASPRGLWEITEKGSEYVRSQHGAAKRG